MKTENKTRATKKSVKEFLANIESIEQRKDAEKISTLMEKITGEKPVMWGPSIVGFGNYHYKYDSGREGDMPVAAFSPRSTNLTLYIVDGTSKQKALLNKLGPHKTGKVCLYIKRLSDVDMKILEEIIKDSYQYVMSHEIAMHRAK